LDLIQELHLSKDASIIDVGGGDSFLVDHLLEQSYTNITVLDISQAALARAQERLGAKAALVKWIEVDASGFEPTQAYDCWHDRATFHFLREENEIQHYLAAARKGIKAGGQLILGTFSEKGPNKCSGIEIIQYSQESMTEKLSKWFDKIKCITSEHLTPFNTVQQFVFCRFSPKVL
jgi:ubiquinone/menaquinone biosynthesis C-methylase UbiE